VRLNSSQDLVVTSSGSPVGPLPSIESQYPFWSADVRRGLFSLESPVVSEANPPVFSETETVPLNTTYQFTLPDEMFHLALTTSVPTGFTAAGLPPINTQRMPNVIPTLPPRYHALNALLNAPVQKPTQTPSSTPGAPSYHGHPIPGFISTLPQFPSGNLNPSGTIPTIAPNL
jgi:hypothetical protein